MFRIFRTRDWFTHRYIFQIGPYSFRAIAHHPRYLGNSLEISGPGIAITARIRP